MFVHVLGICFNDEYCVFMQYMWIFFVCVRVCVLQAEHIWICFELCICDVWIDVWSVCRLLPLVELSRLLSCFISQQVSISSI